MKLFAKILSTLFGLALIAGTVTFVVWVVKSFFTYISAVPKEMGASLIAGTATILVATLTVTIGRYFERKRELDALYRDKKTEIYDEFLKEFFDLFLSGGKRPEGQPEKDLVSYLREFTRKLVLWSGPGVIEAFVAWKDHLANGTPDAQTIFLTEAFLLSIRKDLRHTNSGLRKGFFARLFLQQGSLFLSMADQNPNVSLAELAKAEELLKAAKSE